MKQKLGFLCAVLLLSCLLAAPSFAEDAEEEVPVGTAGQRLYHRHRYLYRRGPIASYNIGGTTVVSVSDLPDTASGGVGPGDPVGNGHVGPAAGAHAGA